MTAMPWDYGLWLLETSQMKPLHGNMLDPKEFPFGVPLEFPLQVPLDDMIDDWQQFVFLQHCYCNGFPYKMMLFGSLPFLAPAMTDIHARVLLHAAIAGLKCSARRMNQGCGNGMVQ